MPPESRPLPPPVAASSARPRRVLLVGWDAADWQVIHPLLDSGQMPALARLIEGGVLGNLATLHPKISPMLWNSIATGKTADKHGIHGFTEPDPATGVRPFSSVSRRTKAIWNILQQALGWRCNVVGWWASHPAEPLRGTVVTNYFTRTRRVGEDRWQVPPHAVHPPERAAEFGPLRMQPDEVTEGVILPFIPRAGEIDQENDRSLENFARLFTECCSIQAAATAAMAGEEDWDFTAVYFDSIDHFSHAYMPFHPPRQPHVPEQEFERYRDVIVGIYRLQDMMLERLVDLAGPETLVVVCSDHGFQSGALRPLSNPQEPAGPVLWHRDFGILVLHGPGVKRDERVYGATLLDLVPTLLTLLGLPVGEDMDGKPIFDALVDPTPPQKIPSWDQVPGDDGRHPPDFDWQASPEAAQELVQQFAALGYVDNPAADREQLAADTARENRYNLAQVHLAGGQTDPAVAILEELVVARPWESRFLHQLANAYVKAGYLRAADELLARAYPGLTALAGSPEEVSPEIAATVAAVPLAVWILAARAKLGRGQTVAAAACLRGAMGTMLRHPPAWVETGWLWLESHEPAQAEKCFRRAVELDSECAPGWQGLAAVYLRRRQNDAAIDAALEATQLLFHLPMTHAHLGIALARQGRHAEAIVAFKRAVAMEPGLVAAHRWLAALHRQASAPGGGSGGSVQNAAFLADAHRAEAQRRFRERAVKTATRRARCEALRPLLAGLVIPTPAERQAREAQARPNRAQAAAAEAAARAQSGRTFLLVSGLPRSGTSLMMQILQAGGLSPRTDGERTADEDNPEGYLEWEAIKRVAKQPELLDEPGLENQAIKVISLLLPALPRHHRYRVLFMRRPPREIARSQAKMIARRGGGGADAENADRVAARLRAHREETLAFLRGQPEVFDLLEIDYPALVADPEPWVARVTEFVGPERLPHRDRMAGVVRRDLHRNR